MGLLKMYGGDGALVRTKEANSGPPENISLRYLASESWRSSLIAFMCCQSWPVMCFSIASCSSSFLSIKVKNEQFPEIQRRHVVKYCNAPFAVRFLFALWKVLCFGQISLWVKSPVTYWCITPPTLLRIYLPQQHTYFIATLLSWLSAWVSRAQSYSSPAPLCVAAAQRWICCQQEKE